MFLSTVSSSDFDTGLCKVPAKTCLCTLCAIGDNGPSQALH